MRSRCNEFSAGHLVTPNPQPTWRLRMPPLALPPLNTEYMLYCSSFVLLLSFSLSHWFSFYSVSFLYFIYPTDRPTYLYPVHASLRLSDLLVSPSTHPSMYLSISSLCPYACLHERGFPAQLGFRALGVGGRTKQHDRFLSRLLGASRHEGFGFTRPSF